MLALSRRPGEYIMIGDDIMVKVVRVNGSLKLAVEAPREVKIVRGEVYERSNKPLADR